MAGQGRARQVRAGQGRTGLGRAGQGRCCACRKVNKIVMCGL